jgi:hypothetical protein
MPCDTIQLNRIDLGKVNQDILKQALEGLGIKNFNGYDFTHMGTRVYIQDGELSSRLDRKELENLRNNIKVSYSKKVLAQASQKFNWQVKQTGQNKYQFIKR